ncbi:MAG: YybH family protein, partial [Candidatus Rhabdochlamydia sp.]
MKKNLSFSLFFILSFTSLFALNTSDRNAINKVVEHFAYAWNDCEGKGFGDYYAQDADFVNIFGTAFSGKQEIETRHIKILETFLKGSIFEVIETKVREIKPEVVIAQVYWKVTNIQKSGAETMKGIFTHTFVKNNGTWEITSTQNTLI